MSISKELEHILKENLQNLPIFKILEVWPWNVNITDAQGRMLYMNESTARELGSSREELLNTPISQLVKKGILADSAIMQVIRTKEKTTRYVAFRGGGGLITYSIPIKDNNGKVQYILTVSKNDDDFNFLVDQLKQDKESLDRKMRQMDSLLNPTAEDIIAESPQMRDVLRLVKRVASSDSSVLITGESGTGKEIIANYLHQNSKRAANFLLPVNCSTIPYDLIESEFFGYEKGTFTGALQNGKSGLFELVDNGTLFLDEIEAMPLSMQPKLLRALESGEYRRLGGDTLRTTNARIISASNKDLKELVRSGEFRKDLYYRLSVITIELPPLHNRKEDILPLAQLFLEKLNRKYNREYFFDHSTLQFFLSYRWPGNIRELRNIVESLVITSNSPQLSISNSIINPRNLLNTQNENASIDSAMDTLQNNQSPMKVTPLAQELTKAEIETTLTSTHGNISRAASLLNITRRSLYRRIEKHNIDIITFRK